MRTVNWEQAGVALRGLLRLLGLYLVYRGIIDEQTWLVISAVILEVVLSAFSAFGRSDTNLLVSAANVPGTEVIPPDPMKREARLRAHPNIRTAAALFLCMFLMGCQEQRPTIVGTITNSLPVEVQERILRHCGWIEPLTTLSKIIAMFPGLEAAAIIEQATNEVCDAVKPKDPNIRARSVPVVNGVKLEGGFVR